MSLSNFLSSARLQFCTFVARSFMGFTMSGLESRPSQSAFINIRQALGANSPRASSSWDEMLPSTTKGVAACLTFSKPVMDLYRSTVCNAYNHTCRTPYVELSCVEVQSLHLALRSRRQPCEKLSQQCYGCDLVHDRLAQEVQHLLTK